MKGVLRVAFGSTSFLRDNFSSEDKLGFQRYRQTLKLINPFSFSVQSAVKKHNSASRSKQRRACAACSRYVGTSRLYL